MKSRALLIDFQKAAKAEFQVSRYVFLYAANACETHKVLRRKHEVSLGLIYHLKAATSLYFAKFVLSNLV